ncbi:MAG TPA: hypothetical protein VN155_16870 [Devosia sp.]|nr:hypothetical protein [Devosia sp.]
MITDPIRSKVSQADKTFHITTSTEAKMFRLRCGQQWLHWSGTFLTDLRAHAWAGTAEQARNIRRSKKYPAARQCRPVRFDEVNTAHKISED